MKSILKCVLVSIILAPLASYSHHSAFGRYDTNAMIEIEGEVIAISWKNPHGYITVEVTDSDGQKIEWGLETGAPSILRRSGLKGDTIKVGDHVRAAGQPPLTEKREIFAKNILLPNGEELLLTGRATPRWTRESRSDYSFWHLKEGDPSDPELGIFRVWVTSLDSISPLNRSDLTVYPMTDAAQTAQSSFDPVRNSPTRNCTPKGMPTIMDQPYPIEFSQAGNMIRLLIEEYDIVRTIHLDREVPPSGQPESPLGYSLGEWDGATLVVTTTHLNWPYFNQRGIPQSKESVLVERFSPSDDGSRLGYQLVITDPVNFTEPVVIENYWLYDSNAEVLLYNCQVRD